MANSAGGVRHPFMCDAVAHVRLGRLVEPAHPLLVFAFVRRYFGSELDDVVPVPVPSAPGKRSCLVFRAGRDHCGAAPDHRSPIAVLDAGSTKKCGVRICACR